MDFGPAIEAQLRGQRVRRARLVWFDFATEPMGVWNGARPLTTSDGRTWLGLRGLGRIEGIAQSIDGAAPEIRFSLSGVYARFAAMAKAETAEYVNRPVFVFSQFFTGDDHMNGPWQLLGAPWAETWGLMHSLIPEKKTTADGFERTVTLTAETPFASKKRTRAAYMSDPDQKARHPGDRIAEFIAGIESVYVKFPK
ncbi:hypothetical protein [Methylopila sp. 73B]|uniref:hypothetical protein n=1 Tax=Methylopila sp. 73B TaxID=1120792 RepID=UPI0004637B3B|nr:hypothetical protein [Methylopila sp. 73B]